MKYTDLDIHQAIDLVKAGCKWVFVVSEQDYVMHDQMAWFINEQYRIETDKLEAFYDCPKCHQGELDFGLYCDNCKGKGKKQ